MWARNSCSASHHACIARCATRRAAAASAWRWIGRSSLSTYEASCAQYSNSARSSYASSREAAVSSNAPWRLKSTSRWLRATTAVGSSCRQRSARTVSSRSWADGLPAGRAREPLVADREPADGGGVGRDHLRLNLGRRKYAAPQAADTSARRRTTPSAIHAVVADRRAEHQRAQRVDDRRDGLVLGDPPQRRRASCSGGTNALLRYGANAATNVSALAASTLLASSPKHAASHEIAVISASSRPGGGEPARAGRRRAGSRRAAPRRPPARSTRRCARRWPPRGR